MVEISHKQTNTQLVKFCELLDEYSSKCIELEKIKDKIFDYRDTIKKKFLLAGTNEEKHKIFLEFRKEIKNFKNDKTISQKYKDLKKQKDNLRARIVNYSKFDYETDDSLAELYNLSELQDLLDKYSKKCGINSENTFSSMSSFNIDEISSNIVTDTEVTNISTVVYANANTDSLGTLSDSSNMITEVPSEISEKCVILNKEIKTLSDIHYTEQHNEVNDLVRKIKTGI